MSLREKVDPFLSIVFSFRNEQDVLPELLERVRSVMNEEKVQGLLKDYELIFVNDASTDRSVDILENLNTDINDIRIINMSRVFGVAPCVMAGLAYSQGDLVVYMDADLQDPPDLIPEMINAWRKDEHVEVVHTVRRSREGEGPLKLFFTKIGYWILNRYSSVPIPKEAGDFKLLTRRAVEHILKLKENNPFMRGLISWVGFKQAFVPYDRQARHAGQSKFFVLGHKVMSNFLTSAVVQFSSVPLQIAAYCGLLAIVIDLIFMIHALCEKFSGQAIPGWTALMIVILFIGGVQLFCIGMIGLYLHAVHEQTKMRPRYIVDSLYGFPSDMNLKNSL